MKRVTKQSLIEDFKTLLDKCNKMHDNLKPFYNNGKITHGEYWYLLNPMQNYGVKNIYGFDGFKCMILKPNQFKVWDFEYMLNSLKSLYSELQRKIEEL